MVDHLVLFKLKPDATAEQKAAMLAARLRRARSRSGTPASHGRNAASAGT